MRKDGDNVIVSLEELISGKLDSKEALDLVGFSNSEIDGILSKLAPASILALVDVALQAKKSEKYDSSLKDLFQLAQKKNKHISVYGTNLIYCREDNQPRVYEATHATMIGPEDSNSIASKRLLSELHEYLNK